MPEDGQTPALLLSPLSPDLPRPPNSHVSGQAQGRHRGPDLADGISGFQSQPFHGF